MYNPSPFREVGSEAVRGHERNEEDKHTSVLTLMEGTGAKGMCL